MVTFEYNGFTTQLYVAVYDESKAEDIISVEPMAYDSLTVSMGDNARHQIKTVVTYGDKSRETLWAKSKHGIGYSYDTTALEIDENSIITPKKQGSYEVTVSVGKQSAVLTVNITE